MADPEVGTIIEGVGDELIHGLIGVVVVLFLIILLMSGRLFNRPQGIHPDNEQRVEQTRQHLNRQGEGGTAGQQNGPSNTYTTEVTCPVCLQERRLSTETNCGHLFCGECLIAYWRHGNWLGAIACPVCRQQVTILFPVFQEDVNSDDARELVGEINNYNRRFSGEPRPIDRLALGNVECLLFTWEARFSILKRFQKVQGFMDYIYDLPTLLRHVVREFFSFSGLVWMFRIRILVCFIAALLYFISPLDIIPEAVFGILGLLDDVFIMLLLAIYVSIIYRGVIANRGEAH